jgi:hypothetical protein
VGKTMVIYEVHKIIGFRIYDGTFITKIVGKINYLKMDSDEKMKEVAAECGGDFLRISTKQNTKLPAMRCA